MPKITRHGGPTSVAEQLRALGKLGPYTSELAEGTAQGEQEPEQAVPATDPAPGLSWGADPEAASPWGAEVEPEVVDEPDAGAGTAVNAETGEETPAGQPLPEMSADVYPPDAVPLEPADAPVVDNATVRAWAVEHSIQVSSRGRIPQAVVDQYLTAQREG